MSRLLKWKLVPALLVGAAIGTAVYGLAATLDVVSDDLGAGDDVVAACDTTGVGVSYEVAYDGTLATYVVTAATVDGIDVANCTGQEISVTLTGPTAGAELVSAGPVAIAAESVPVPITEPIPAADVVDVHVVITGDDPTP